MKKLIALASMAVLLCASASFAKKALDEEEMDLVTAAGQPSIIDITVTTTGGDIEGSTNTNSTVFSEISNGNLDTNDFSTAFVEEAQGDANIYTAGGGLNAETDSPFLGFDITGAGALNIDVSDADIDTFSLSVASGSIGTLTATASASASSAFSGATASVSAMHEDSSNTTLVVAEGSQSDLRALVVNNIVGENQIANGINIRSGAASTSDDSDQSNTITQSWGSSYDWTFAEGEAVAGTAAAGGSADGAQGGTGGNLEKVNCVLSDDCGNSSANGGAGGDGGAGGSAAGVVLEHMPLTISSDKISRVVVNSSGDANVNVGEMDSATTQVIVDTGSQTNLAALVVNNIGGRNQIATGFNVAANGSVSLGIVPGNLVLFDSTTTGHATYGGGQSNTINQFRGTPYNQE